MATPLKSPNTIDFNSAKVSARKAATQKYSDSFTDLRYKLTTVLQTTLEVEQLLKLFQKELLTTMELDGLRYLNDNQKFQVVSGKQTTHSCGYRLITPKDHLGEIIFYRSKRFSEKEMEIIEVLLSTLICPLRNAIYYQEAVVAALTDPLTGAGNRIALNNALIREIELSKRHQQPLSILLLDIDRFKNINDEYGHIAGDNVLKKLVETLSDLNRSTDINFRYGGEEFVVILNKTDLDGALIIAERIRQQIENTEIIFENDSINLTVSIGASTFRKGDSIESLFNRADKALYQVKEGGRNQVCGA